MYPIHIKPQYYEACESTQAFMTFEQINKKDDKQFNITIKHDNNQTFSNLNDYVSFYLSDNTKIGWHMIDVFKNGRWISGCDFNTEMMSNIIQPNQNNIDACVPRSTYNSFNDNETWKIRPCRKSVNNNGEGHITRYIVYENPVTNENCYTYDITIDGGDKADIYSIHDYVNELCYSQVTKVSGEGWRFVEIEINGVWYRGDRVVQELFGISFEKTPNGTTLEITLNHWLK